MFLGVVFGWVREQKFLAGSYMLRNNFEKMDLFNFENLEVLKNV